MSRRARMEGLRRAASSRWADVWLALALTVLGQIEITSAGAGASAGWLPSLYLAVQTGAVAFRRSHTVTAAIVSAAALVAEAATGSATNTLAGLVAGLVITYSIGRHLGGRALLLASGVVAVGLGLHIAALPSAAMSDYAFAALFTGIAWVLGRGTRGRARERAAAEREAKLSAEGQEARVAAAVAEERARIAREMHDVVAHGMSVMVVQAAAAEHLLTSDPSLAREPLATVRHTGHESLDEMRRLLGLLRTDDGAGVGRAPQPSLAQIPDLVARLQAAGRPVSLRIEGPDIDVPAGVGLCAYRIVQESLTNALKHAAGAESAVTLVREPDRITVTILNGRPLPRPVSTGTLPGASLGIRGMRERAAIYGGQLIAEPTSDGGFLVHATLPIRG